MKSKKKIGIIFICALIVSIFLLGFMLTQPSMRRIVFHEVHEGDYPIIVVGQSHAETAIDPFILSENEEGKQAFNLARRWTSLNNMYYVIKEADIDHKVEKVYMEIDEAYWHKNTGTIKRGRDSNLIYNLSWELKPEYFFNELIYQNFINAFFDYNITPDAIAKVPGNVKVKLSKLYRDKDPEAVEFINKTLHMGKSYDYIGRGYRYGFAKSGLEYDEFRDFRGGKIGDEQKAVFKKICDYCEDNDIELVCFVSALPPYRLANENHDVVNKYFTELCDENGVEFLDFNYAKAEYLGRTDEDYVDLDGHMMGPLAEKQSRLINAIEESDNHDEFFYDTYEEVLENIK